LYLNKSAGIDVSEVQPWKVYVNPAVLTSVLYLNKSAGNDVSEEQP
jgi:hypothetical protein